MEGSGILVWVPTVIVLVLVFGSIKTGDAHLVPQGVGRISATLSTLFNQFLPFAVPLIIIGLVTPAVTDLGRDTGKWLGVTVAIAYGSTLFSGFLTHLACAMAFPEILQGGLADIAEPGSALETHFTVEVPAAVSVVTALPLSFVVGIGLATVPRGILRKGFIESRAIITRLIEHVIILLLPLRIFDILLDLTYTGEAWAVMRTFVRVVIVILILEVVVPPSQYLIASVIGKKNPIKPLLTMMPAYLMVLSTSSLAATIPVTLRQTKKSGVSNPVVFFTVPLRVTIHLAGPTSKILAFVFAIAFTQGTDVTPVQWIGFVFMLGITMVATPGVPGGAIMAATDLLPSMLGSNDMQVALMIVTYIALDPFGTATNVTGNGAVVIIADRFADGRIGVEGDLEDARELSLDGVKYLDKVSVEGLVSVEELRASAARVGENVVLN